MAPFLRQTTLACFFCLSPISPAPLDPRSFRCPHCACWNRYGPHGDILSDDPAMHDENLNAPSFAKRASPSKDRLPSAYPNPSFCHTCQTNQMLIVNLLSNYLPAPQHPDYPHRLEQLPAYRDSLHVRYPPVCASCLPAVEDEIEQKNQMARTAALGGWLKESRGQGKQRLVSGSTEHRETLARHLAIWRVRGALWSLTLLCVLMAYAAAIRGYAFPSVLARATPALPLLSFLSLFYAAWDPTYYRFRKAKVQGRDVRIKGKTHYIILQTLAWFSRLITSTLLFFSWRSSSWDYLDCAAYPLSYRVSVYCSILLTVELLVFSLSFTILHLQRPPAIRLIESTSRFSSVRDTPESSTRSARASPMPTTLVNPEPDLFASLTLSGKPFINANNPMFGQPSMASPTPQPPNEPDEDAMDWTPTVPSPIKVKTADGDDGTWMRPQRFFPPEHPTGLENLFANTRLDDADAGKSSALAQGGRCNSKTRQCWIAIVPLIIIPLATLIYHHQWMKGWIP